MARLVEDVLESWRACERLVDDGAIVEPERGMLEQTAGRLRDAYQLLTAAPEPPAEVVRSSEAWLLEAQDLLDRVAGRSESGRPALSAAGDDSAR